MRYKVAGGKLVVKARSSIHDTNTVWDKLSGDVEADPETLATAGAVAKFTVDMTSFDAGDWLKNRKLRKDFDMESHPVATFELTKVRDVVREGASFRANAEGVLRWRGKEVALALAGEGKLDATSVQARATFELDIKRLGLSAPRILMFKVEDEVTVDVSFTGAVVA
ncbi:MAG: YceI family protein [Deltaproteobacteria bacterium]|nr:YceI family protein [Deltaproteobacteria bacterium]MCW5805223.1 YceI family protein [Deltaproteobacteria bacterium]